MIAAPRTILLFSSMGIGDAIMFSPTLRNLHRAWPKASVDVVYTHAHEKEVWEVSRYIRCCEGLAVPHFEAKRGRLDRDGLSRQESAVQWFGFLMRWAGLVRRLRRQRYDLILTHFNCSSRPDVALAVLLCGARVRAGYESTSDYPNLFAFVYTHRVIIDPSSRFVDMSLGLLRVLSMAVVDDHPEFTTPDAARGVAASLLPTDNRPRVLIAPGVSFFRQKQWRVECFAEVANALLDAGDTTVVIAGTQRDTAILPLLRSATTNLIGKLSLSELAAVVSLCDVVVCCEGGVMHLADALGVACVALYGPQNRLWAPPFHNDRITVVGVTQQCAPCNDFRGHKRMRACRHPRCMERITVQQVMDALRQRLSERGTSSKSPEDGR